MLRHARTHRNTDTCMARAPRETLRSLDGAILMGGSVHQWRIRPAGENPAKYWSSEKGSPSFPELLAPAPYSTVNGGARDISPSPSADPRSGRRSRAEELHHQDDQRREEQRGRVAPHVTHDLPHHDRQTRHTADGLTTVNDYELFFERGANRADIFLRGPIDWTRPRKSLQERAYRPMPTSAHVLVNRTNSADACANRRTRILTWYNPQSLPSRAKR